MQQRLGSAAGASCGSCGSCSNRSSVQECGRSIQWLCSSAHCASRVELCHCRASAGADRRTMDQLKAPRARDNIGALTRCVACVLSHAPATCHQAWVWGVMRFLLDPPSVPCGSWRPEPVERVACAVEALSDPPPHVWLHEGQAGSVKGRVRVAQRPPPPRVGGWEHARSAGWHHRTAEQA